MAIIPKQGYQVDPNNPNGVVPTGSAIAVDSLNASTPSLNVTPPTTVPVPNVSGISVSTPPTIPTPPITNQPAPGFVDNLKSLIGMKDKKTVDTTTTVANATAPFEAQLNDINNQIKQHDVQALKNSEAALKSGETTGFASREAQNIARTDAIDRLALVAQGELIQGNLALAEKHATNAINTKYAQIEADIATAKDNITNNYDTFTPEQKKIADATLARLDGTATQTADNKKALTDAVNYAQTNGDSKALGDLLKLSPYSPTFTQDLATIQGTIKGSTLDDQYKQLQIQKLQQEVSTAKETGSPNVVITNDAGNTVSIPTDVAPYYNVASNGVEYIDASTLQGTAKDKTNIINQANKAGYKVITNKNTAADLVNIKDANSKLDTVSTIMSGIAQPGWLARTLGGFGLTKLSALAQSDPQKAAAGTLESIGLDVLKAISGVQGFRGNQSAIQQVTDHLPKVTDTTDTINQKIEYVKALIADRENAAVGKPKSDATNTDQVVNGVTYSKSADGLYYPKK